MHVLDLFSGIGGFSLGLERAGMRTVAFCESDGFARRVLARHWPGVPCFEDIRGLRAADLCQLPRAELVCGGFPCQDVSSAGPGGGLDGARSGLWHEMLRIVRELRPGWVVVENVSALRVRGADRVLAGLEAAGYACWPLVVGAAHAGAPHRRGRVFVVAHADGAGLEGRLGRAAWAPPVVPVAGCGRWLPEPGMGRVADGLSTRLDRRVRVKALGNAVVPAIACLVGQAILAAERRLRFQDVAGNHGDGVASVCPIAP